MGRKLELDRIGTIRQNIRDETMMVIEYNNANDIIVEFQDEYKAKVHTMWQAFMAGNVANPKGLSIRYENIVGQQFNRLTVIKMIRNDKNKILWECSCSCGNPKHIFTTAAELRSGHTKSCGCLKFETGQQLGLSRKGTRYKYNQYDLSNEYGIGYSVNTHQPFYFDKSDYEMISNYTWSEHNGYIITASHRDGTYINMHRLLLGVTDDSLFVDHINHNKSDNRRSNLRIVRPFENSQNHIPAKNNTSGITGVSWESKKKVWSAYIGYDGKNHHLGRFKNKEDAIKARKEAEEKIFGIHSYENSMKIADKHKIYDNIKGEI